MLGLGLVTLLASLWAPAPAATGTAPAAFSDAIVVTATAPARGVRDVPYAVERLDREVLEQAAAPSVPELMARLPGVMAQQTARGQGSPFVRGFTGFRNLFLIEGIRLNHAAFRDGPNPYWSTVDPLSLERVELVRGPASAIWGSDAVGATVNVVTAAVPGGRGRLGGTASYRFASAERAQTARLGLDGRPAERARFRLGVTGKRFGDLRAGGATGRQPRTGYDEWDADLKVELDLADDRQLVVGAHTVAQDDVWRTHRTIFAVPWRGTTAGDEQRRSLDQRRTLGWLQLRAQPRGRWADGLWASLSYQVHDERRLRVRGDGRSDRSGFEVATLGSWLRLERSDRRGRWSYGVERYRDQATSFSRRFAADGTFLGDAVQGPVGDDADYERWGVYAQREHDLGPRTSLVLGLRHERVAARARRVADPASGAPIRVDGRWHETVGNARFTHALGSRRHWSLYGGVARAFRAPNLSDLTRFDSARSDEIETPSPGLLPERFTSYELGLRAGRRGWSGSVVLFLTEIDGMIVRVPTGRVVDGEVEVTKRNAGDGFVHGVELAGSARLGRAIELRADLTWLEGEVDTFPRLGSPPVAEPIDRMMPATGHLRLRWQPPARALWLELVGTLAGTQDRLSSRDRADRQRIPPGGTPGYAVLTARAGRPFGRVDLTAALENLTDVEYRIHGSGLNRPGRNLVVAARLDF